jgi:predicted aspartyl protease
MKLSTLGTLMTFLVLAASALAQTDANTNPASREAPTAAPEVAAQTYIVNNATPEQDATLRAQIQIMHPEILPLRVFFMPHLKCLGAARTFQLHVPTGYASVMFTHLPSRTIFIDNDRYLGEEWLGYWIAHELGHLATNSARENDAERAAHEFRKRLKQAQTTSSQLQTTVTQAEEKSEIGLANQPMILSQNFAPLSAAEPPTEIPFKLYGGFAVIVRGAISSQENLSLFVDTGAVPSVIHQRLARKLNLSGSPEVISVLNQNRTLERVSLAGLRLGPVQFPAVSAVVLDLEAIESRLGLRVDAIIGLDVLARQNFTIDYRHHRLLIGEALATGDPIPFELKAAAGAPYIVVSIKVNSQRVRLLLDTGADSLTLFAPRVRGLAMAVLQTGVRKDVGGAGEYEVNQVRLLNARLGGIERASLPAAVVNSPDSALRDFDGLLGPTFLGITRLALDFRTSTLYVESNR